MSSTEGFSDSEISDFSDLMHQRKSGRGLQSPVPVDEPLKMPQVPVLSTDSIGVKLDSATIKQLPVDLEGRMSIAALIEFEENRKRLEALNTKKKDELKRVIEDRAKKTEEDLKQLNYISAELKKLDSTLSNDVSILRKQIEAASLDFMEAQKRFERSEKDYLESKLDLFTKQEKKELLTSHLCSIIEQNELRKAKKLSDLMGQLEISSMPQSALTTESNTVSPDKSEDSNDLTDSEKSAQ